MFLSVASWVIISMYWMIVLILRLIHIDDKKRCDLNIIGLFSLLFIKIKMKWGMASLQLPAKYPQLENRI